MASGLPNEVGFGTFEVVRLRRPGTAAELAGVLAERIGEEIRRADGFVSMRVHVSLDDDAVICHGRWTGEAEYRSWQHAGRVGSLRGLADRFDVLSLEAFGGFPAAGIAGPATAESPGIVAVATRHVGGHAAAETLGGLLQSSGGWKRHVAGFIGASAFISADGTTYVNYPEWVDRSAFDAYMADPRIAEGQAEIAPLETAEPEFVLCSSFAEIVAAGDRNTDQHVNTDER